MTAPILPLKSVLRSAESAEEDIWRTFGAKIEISARNRPAYRLLIDGVRCQGMSITNVFSRWGETDVFKSSGDHVNIKLLTSGQFDVFGDFGRYGLTGASGLVCHSEHLHGYASGEATRARTILIERAVFDRVLTDHLGPGHAVEWTGIHLFDSGRRLGALIRAAMLIIDENHGDDADCVYSEKSIGLTRDALIVSIGEHIRHAAGLSVGEAPEIGSKKLIGEALDLIRAQDRPLTIHDLATALGIGVRALQAGFRRHVGASPGYILRMGRLDGAHRDLESGRAVTALDAARLWGFSNAGRFATEYKNHLGEYPSETIRQRDRSN